MRFGIDRYIVYLPASIENLNRIDGSREQRIRSKIGGFLDSPKGSIDGWPSDSVVKIKDRNVKMRAFGTWCEAPPFDVLVVQIVFRKDNEDEYWADIGRYTDVGDDYEEQFDSMSEAEAHEWLEAAKEEGGIEVVGGED